MKIFQSVRLLSTIILTFAILPITFSQPVAKEPVDYVNPYIGNISHLIVPTYPTVHLPNSMLCVTPERSDYTTDMIRGLPVAVTSHRGSEQNVAPPSAMPVN